MRSAPAGTVSIVSLLYVTTLPFLISAAAVYFSPFALFTACFGKAFLFAFTAVAISGAYIYDGWLVARLILFSDLVLLPGLYFLWLRLLPVQGRMSGLGLAAMIAFAVLVSSVDYQIISPCLAVLINI